MRIIFIKQDCSLCKEALISVGIFNGNCPRNRIRIVDVESPGFHMFEDMVLEVIGNEFQTPFWIFDHQPIQGTRDWRGNLSYLNSLNQHSKGVIHNV